KRAMPCVKVGQAVIGLEVRHAHIHLVPMQTEKDMHFGGQKLKLQDDELRSIADSIYKEFQALYPAK
ncbi:MAG: HIT family protein, partial [Prevotella sp.]|nr:HIT family protein [Prevotella sp.]